ncbi:hypothetical protein N1Z41_00035880 [Pseudomonas aeruginosa]
MQFTVTINQAKALEWGLNSQQALLFAFVYECPSWARLVQTPAGDFYALSEAKILEGVAAVGVGAGATPLAGNRSLRPV